MINNSIYPNDWIKIAKEDFERIEKRLKEVDLKDAAFHLQQALEKYIKAFLLEKGWKLKKTHELEDLLDEAIKYKTTLETFYPLCARVSGYYMIDRYPRGITDILTTGDLKNDMKEAEKLIDALFPNKLEKP